MQPTVKLVITTTIGILCLILYCEYFLYYLVQRNCNWPVLDAKNEDQTIKKTAEAPVRVMVLADTHLLGSRRGHWFDKIRREWQMHRTFQTAMILHKPELVFVLGDLTDEGLFCSNDEFEYYTRRFHKLFAVPEGTMMHVAVGNHDIGFHHEVTPYLNRRFITGFKSPGVQMISVRGNNFVLLNSMALEGDGCFLCRPAELELSLIEKVLKCAKGDISCDSKIKLKNYSKPILMQHYPLYRESDIECDEPDEAPIPLKQQKFKEAWDCLSKGASYQLLKQLNPRLVMSGHTHHGCTIPLETGEGIEITIPSFSWRNKDNPSYGLVVFTPNNYAFFKCLMPRESTLINTYLMGFSCLLAWIIYSYYKMARKIKYKYH